VAYTSLCQTSPILQTHYASTENDFFGLTELNRAARWGLDLP
jgi:hypothetical protein